MKTLLLITVCEQNKERIFNQINNLNKHKDYLVKFNIEPVFVYGNPEITIDTNPYNSWKVEVEEKNTTLYKKILAAFKKALNQDFDYVIKIDDDTLFNIDLFDKIKLDADCIGRVQKSFSENSIAIDLPMYNFKKTIKWHPTFFADVPFFFTGDFYIFSRKVIEFIVSSKAKLLEICSTQHDYVPEDQLMGYALKDQWSTFTKKDIALATQETILNVLQITDSVISLHPVHNDVFGSMLELAPEDQLKKLVDGKGTNFWYRKSMLKKLENNLRQVLFDFIDSKKSSGMG